ncbi:MAG TPA: DUF2147 domain-containing protein [Bacteroidales bacterium]|jgi:uncharacterized membrane protein|nr:DUF2147 domain-containing protein [Bacteroidales bacterium]HXK82657.1 DUF2147 domain-containing protein [Bacteroidales bacterium]
MKKTIGTIVILLFFAVSVYSQQENIVDTYLTANKKMKVEFYQINGQYSAKVVWKAEDADKDVNIGDVIIENLVYNSKLKQYENGTLTAKGRTLDCMILFLNTNQIKIFMRYGFIKKEVIWTRV